MSNNHSIEVPTVRPLGASYDVDYSTTSGGKILRGLDIMAPGSLVITDAEDNDVTYDFSGLTTGVPYRLILLIKKIKSASTIALANMIGLH